MIKTWDPSASQIRPTTASIPSIKVVYFGGTNKGNIMAHRKSSAIGDLHGRVDNMMFRTRNGKNIAYAIPVNQKIPDSKKAFNTRKNFAAANSLASVVNSVPVLKGIWTAAKVRGSNSYQKLVSMNTRLAREGSLSTLNVITPPDQFLKLNSASVENEMILLSFLCPGNPCLSFPAALFVYLYFGKSGGSITPLMVQVPEPESDSVYEIDVLPDLETKKLLAKDPSPVIYIALAGGTSYKKKVYWTSTASVGCKVGDCFTSFAMTMAG